MEYLLYLRKSLRVMVIPNTSKPGVAELMPRLLVALNENQYSVVLTPEFVQATEDSGSSLMCIVDFDIGTLEEKLPGCDMLIVVGGDGTIIRHARAAANAKKPILGINAGRLGFLSGLEPEHLSRLSQLQLGGYETEHRRFLEVEHHRAKDGKVSEYLTLNDLVLSNGMISTIVDMDIFCNGAPVNSYRADGVIVSSPTGSTAYALAAGGPIIHPEIDCFSVTPICPHSLANRSILFPGSSEVRIRMANTNRHPMFVTCDGMDSAPFEAGDTIVARLSEMGLDLLNLTGTSFYERINEKFGGGSVC